MIENMVASDKTSSLLGIELRGRPCPICRDRAAAQLFAEPDLGRAALDKFAFASRKLPEYML